MISASWPVEVTHSALSIDPGGRVQPRPRLDQRLIGQHVDGAAGTLPASTDPASGTLSDQPPAPSSSTRSRSMAWRSSKACSTTDHVGLGHPGRRLHHHRLVELLDRAVDVLQPAHDRGGHHGPDALIDHAALAGGHAWRPGPAGPRSARRKCHADGTTHRPPAPGPPPASTRCCRRPGRRRSRRPRRARARGPGRRSRPGSPRWRSSARGNGRTSRYSGAGRARVSSLPLTVSGSASKHHHCRRTMYRGSRSASAARAAAGSAVPVM